MAASQAMDPRVEQELARLLLTELLAYQLASPVQWIETQNELFAKKGIQRLVEIGPGDTLSSMAKKTLINQQDRYDAATAAKRKLMYYKKDQKDLRYESDPVEKPTKPAVSGSAPDAAPAPAPAATPVPVPAVAAAPVAAAASIADIPVTAKDVVVAIVASKLQKTFGSLATDQSIKQLSGGRSSLENEIVGDIGAEISSLPDKPEEIELDTLGAELQNSPAFTGQLKKVTTALVARLFSLKMPGGFNVAQARSYIETRWGLGSGRQDAIVLRAASSQPAGRLGSEADAKAFFDGIVQEYAKANGLDLSAASAGPAAAAGGPAVQMDAAALSALNKEKQARRKMKIDFLSKLHGFDPNAGDKATRSAQKVIDALQGKLDGLYSELGDTFATGILPVWSAQKVRRFDSSWNWVMQDLFDTFYSIMFGEAEPTDIAIHERSILMANRSDARMLRVARYLIQKTYNMDEERVVAAKQFLQHVIELTCVSQQKPYVAYNIKTGTAPHTELGEKGKIDYLEVPRPEQDLVPSVWLETPHRGGWQKNADFTKTLFDALEDAQRSGLSFRGKNVLITGTGRGSIGAEIVRGLLNGGARVVVTTSSYTPKTVRWYREMFTTHGAQESQLVVVPFNQGSHQDLISVVNYIYDTKDGLGWDLDHVIPFAAISENGREVDSIDSKSELAHRVMLTNLVRLLGVIKKNKETRNLIGRPTQVVLPLSPNHGVFGNDGLYAESKISLETLANKWTSESWADYLCVCSVAIGWTRGTNLMASNDIMAAGIEKLGMRTFSRPEMAFYILLLMGRKVAKMNEIEPLYADLTGGMSTVQNLKEEMTQIQNNIAETTAISKALFEEDAVEKAASAQPAAKEEEVPQQANLQFNYPAMDKYEDVSKKVGYDLNGMVDLDKVVVVTGFSEVGPWGNSRTRWEMESHGRFSVEGCVEMAWIMGLIKHHDGVLDGAHYIGWVDAKTKKPVRDCDIKARYEEEILQHSGIRLIEPDMDDGYDPTQKQFLQEIILEEDLPPFEIPKELARDFEHEHGDKADVVEVPDTNGEQCSIKLKKGAMLLVPKALASDRRIGGQIPAGWDARTYGISDDIVKQVDRVTLFALVSTAESLVSAGLTEPYELYKYLHVSEVGNCVSSGIGGQQSLKGMFKTRYHDKELQNDILQETFVNTTAAWINMLLMSASGPIRTPVGACATSLESLETGYETIISGKAKMCLVGGFDDLTEYPSSEFANMKVTTNDVEEAAAGREPSESSRPTASSRSGFVESQGGGVQVITSARLALDMGMPIHSIIAWVGTASDKVGRSVPAAGKGILVNAREAPSKTPSPLLDLAYRRRRMTLRKQQIQANLDSELELLREDEAASDGSDDALEELRARTEEAKKDAARQLKEATNTLGNEFWHGNQHIAPLRGALAVWGLTIDDLDFASFHGTSTKNNDINETDVIQTQLNHLGRNDGNPILGIFQKYLTGHAKGGAGAWMLNGCMQVLDSGLIPGNRNADNIDAKLRESELIVFPNRTIRTPGVRAFSISSFGFGQKGAQAIGIHPRYLYAALAKEEYESYSTRRHQRHRRAARFFHKAMATNTMFVAKTDAPYRNDQEKKVLLNSTARLGLADGAGYDDSTLSKR